MRNKELKNLCVNWLYGQNSVVCSRPYSFTAKEVADAVGGYAGSVGKVADEVVKELMARGIFIHYNRTPKSCYFELLWQQSKSTT
jgi:hypothetical protein